MWRVHPIHSPLFMLHAKWEICTHSKIDLLLPVYLVTYFIIFNVPTVYILSKTQFSSSTNLILTSRVLQFLDLFGSWYRWRESKYFFNKFSVSSKHNYSSIENIYYCESLDNKIISMYHIYNLNIFTSSLLLTYLNAWCNSWLLFPVLFRKNLHLFFNMMVFRQDDYFLFFLLGSSHMTPSPRLHAWHLQGQCRYSHGREFKL